jgi:hypothetical protein
MTVSVGKDRFWVEITYRKFRIGKVLEKNIADKLRNMLPFKFFEKI